ncbi:peptidase M23 [Bacteroidota bacterium]|nr:peptidase M23 [Bacteroidota bacterium]
MKLFRIFFVALVLGVLFSFTKSIPLLDDNFLRPPLDISLYIAGAFGEPRGDHFHTGIDFSTRGKAGIPVHAIADGYVSRIRVQAGGYGHALYIMHPNGYMSVYGHLSKYSSLIDQYVTDQQFAKKSFEVDLYPEKDLLKVKQGDEIAFSGNTGTSTAPHLHFEIRDASGESFPLNPLKWIHIEDHKAPVINGLMIYQFNTIECLAEEKLYTVTKTGNDYTVTPTIVVNKSKTEIGVRAKDFMDASDADGDFGIYSIHSSIDGKEFYGFSLDILDFAEGRFANAHIDYAENKMKDIQVYRNFLLPGNKASIYNNIINRGIFELNDTLKHEIEIIVKDYTGNEATLKFKIKKSSITNKISEIPSKGFVKLFKWNEDNSYNTDSLKITIPSGNLYQDLYFSCKKKNHAAGKIKSPTYAIGDPFTPIHNSVTLDILTSNIPENLKSKAVICFRNYKGTVSGKTTSWNGNYCETKIREFGDYYVTLDTTKPAVTILSMVEQNLTDNNIKVKITDNLSGVTKYNGYIDGEWILMELDYKTNTLTWNRNAVPNGSIEKSIAAGEHIFKLVVADEVGNTTTKTIKFKI